MKKKITQKNMFHEEPTRSILNLLISFKKEGGLHVRAMEYALNPEKYIESRTSENGLSDDEELQCNIRRNKQNLFNKEIVEKGVLKSREQLHYYLRILVGLNVIGKKGEWKKTKYFIMNDAYNLGLRIQNKGALDLFPGDYIFTPHADTKGRKVLLYGLSESLYHKLGDDKKIIDGCLKEINQAVEKILTSFIKLEENDSKKREEDFLKSTENKKIKELLKNGVEVLYAFYPRIGYNKLFESQIDLTSSKPDFKLFFTHLITRGYNMEEGEFCKIWSNKYFHHDYNLSLKDINELLEWVWDNRDFFNMIYPINMALSIYSAAEETPFEEVERSEAIEIN